MKRKEIKPVGEKGKTKEMRSNISKLKGISKQRVERGRRNGKLV
jgi:hypothetical protein